MIEGIFFDTAGVFYKRQESTRRYALRLVKEQGGVVELSTADETYLKTLKDQTSNGQNSAQAYWDEYFTVRGVTDPAKRAELIEQILEHVQKVSTIPGAHRVVKTLKERGFILGVITSTMYPVEWKMAWLATAGVAEFIDVVACSTELGARTPLPPIYWVALNKAHLTPRQAAFVSSDDRDLAGARRVGMTTVAALSDPDAQADHYARTLPDLLSLPIFQR